MPWSFSRILPALRHNEVARVAALLFLMTAAFIAVVAIQPPSRELRLGSYLPLHTLLETASVVVCALVFLISRRTFGGYQNRNMVILGATFLGVAILDFNHILSYAGMPEFVTPGSPSKAINFWLAARMLAAVALVSVAFMSWERRAVPGETARWTASVLALVAVLSWIFLYRAAWVPQTFVTGQGLTLFKIVSEYVIAGICVVAAYGFYRQIVSASELSSQQHRHDPIALLAACVITGLSEMLFTLYTDVNGLFNVCKHRCNIRPVKRRRWAAAPE